MLDTDTKRRIDTARDILVGKIPDPKSQVEQITIALIYKFMDDMDAESEEMGGERKFFTGDFARYGWPKLMRSGLGGHETLNLYAEAITRMTENPGLPQLFRDIFKNAYLPYRDPETLKAFLKIIDEFEYDHSERLGDAFEYLLSVLGSQGDAGQFRTPRHIIDFIVRIVDPKKTEKILDPACGTAGFLISSYKHILAANVNAKGQTTLTPDERGRLAENFHGYDISPDMVRLSLVNMYLHGFPSPKIDEYDTLTSQDRWNEFADVILANPPFMSPKGGIKPHNRFGVQSKRSEVLFVDYIAEHLTPAGRAGVIVPEGIIFQSQNAYTQLRRMLVENYLVAVVSLPAGVFNPYSGVKTSILIMDKALAKKSNCVAFFKVENDGFGLGAQRRAIEKNDLPQVEAELFEFLRCLRAGQTLEGFEPISGIFVAKEKIQESAECNLGGERYREANSNSELKWPLVSIGELCTIERGASPRPIHDFITNASNGVNWIKIGDAPVGAKYITETKEKITPDGAAKSRFVKAGDFILSNSMSFGRPYVLAIDGCIHDGWLALRNFSDRLDKDFLYYVIGSELVSSQFKRAATGGVVNNLNSEIVRGVTFPLPPIEVQREIVAEIEGYQKVIDGARAVIDNYRPHIPINPDWPMVQLGEVAQFLSGGTPQKTVESFWRGEIPWVSAKDMKSDVLADAELHISQFAIEQSATRLAPKEAVLVLVRGMGLANGVPICELQRPCAFNQDIKALVPVASVESAFLATMLRQKRSEFRRILETAAHGTLKIDTDDLRQMTVPLPPISVQQSIMSELKVEQALVATNRDLIKRFDKKIEAAINRVWGDDSAASHSDDATNVHGPRQAAE